MATAAEWLQLPVAIGVNWWRIIEWTNKWSVLTIQVISHERQWGLGMGLWEWGDTPTISKSSCDLFSSAIDLVSTTCSTRPRIVRQSLNLSNCYRTIPQDELRYVLHFSFSLLFPFQHSHTEKTTVYLNKLDNLKVKVCRNTRGVQYYKKDHVLMMVRSTHVVQE